MPALSWALLPVVMGVLAIAALGERLGWRFIAAIIVATAGVLLITLRLDTEGVAIPSLREGLGIGLVLMAVVCEALFLLLNKKLAKPMPALTLSTLMSAFVLAIGPAGIEIASGATEHVTRAAVIGVAYYALIPTVIGFFLWYEGAARTSAGDAALFTAVLPVSALVLAALVLGEPITPRQAGGCGCVVAAILIGVGRRPGGTRPIEAGKCE
jgi:drug/metabolite transporter (DMT)-like permease